MNYSYLFYLQKNLIYILKNFNYSTINLLEKEICLFNIIIKSQLF